MQRPADDQHQGHRDGVHIRKYFEGPGLSLPQSVVITQNTVTGLEIRKTARPSPDSAFSAPEDRSKSAHSSTNAPDAQRWVPSSRP